MIQRLKAIYNNPYKIVLWVLNHFPNIILNDRLYLQIRYYCSRRRRLNLVNPQTFNEKLQWMKLYNRNPLYTTLVDKYAVKGYVANLIGEQYIIPTLGVWNNVDEIDFSSLPDKFVLKVTHDSGGLVICTDKSKLDINQVKKRLSRALKNDYFYYSREWPYKNVPHRIIAEEYKKDTKTNCLRDYKLYMFNGVFKAMFIAFDREKGATKANYYDQNFERLPLLWGYPSYDGPVEKPQCFDEMIKLAEVLSKGIPHVRVDFYEVDGHVYFGEMTFFDASGMSSFNPPEWNNIFGSWIDLKLVNNE